MSQQEEQQTPQPTEEEAINEEEQEAELPPVEYHCQCHYCDDDSIVPAQIGSPAPNFRVQALLPAGYFQDIELSSYKAEGKWLVLFSIPDRRNSINASEVVAFSDNYSRFTDINCDLLAITPENIYMLNAWCGTPKTEGGIDYINYPFGSDLGHCIHKRYGLSGENGQYLVRGTVLIDPDGIVQHITKNDPSVGRSVEETLRLVKAFQYVRENGVMCPAQWKEGEAAIKPTVAESKDYFDHKYE